MTEPIRSPVHHLGLALVRLEKSMSVISDKITALVASVDAAAARVAALDAKITDLTARAADAPTADDLAALDAAKAKADAIAPAPAPEAPPAS